MNEIGRRIASLREKMRLSQMELAERVGVSAKTIHRWEHGKRIPKGNDLLALAKALNTTVAYLLGETDAPTPAEPEAEPKEKRETRKLLETEEDFYRLIRELTRYNPDLVLRLRAVSKDWSKLSETDKESLAQILYYALDLAAGKLKEPPGKKVEKEI